MTDSTADIRVATCDRCESNEEEEVFTTYTEIQTSHLDTRDPTGACRGSSEEDKRHQAIGPV